MIPEFFDRFIVKLKEEIQECKREFQNQEFNFDNAYICLSVAGIDNETNFRVIDISDLLIS
ncbi:hypothetical protein D3C81_2068050 [compost metagenome]